MNTSNFGKSLEENRKFFDGQQKQWYHIGDGNYARFFKRDDPFVLFDQAPVNLVDQRGSKWKIMDGDFALPLQSLSAFHPVSLDEVKTALVPRNWHRQFLDKWVYIKQGEIEPAVGVANMVYPSAFHLKPYLAGPSGDEEIMEGGEKIVVFNSPFTIEGLATNMISSKAHELIKDLEKRIK